MPASPVGWRSYDPAMSSHARSSRLRYQQYRRDFKDHKTEGTSRTAAGHAIHRKSERSFLNLLAAFFGLIRQHRVTIGIALGLVTFSTLLALVPPYGTKLVVDNVLAGNPLPATMTDTPTDGK